MTRAGLALILALVLSSGSAWSEERASVLSAGLVAPTDRYDHGVLGDAIEYGGLRLEINLCPSCSRVKRQVRQVTLPVTRVFEDVEARVADLDGDGLNEVVVVETDLRRGGSLAVYGPEGKIAATAYIGQTHRWLAPAGIADFDGDGRVEIAYVDRPHLVADLVFVRLQAGKLVETGRLAGLTNHRIGDDHISGGVRDCGAGPELVLASKDWSRLMVVRWSNGPKAADIGAMSAQALRNALACR